MGVKTQGRRVPDNTDRWAEGDYGKVDGVWHCRPPNGSIGDLRNHQVVEHEDGTITVSPSILAKDGRGLRWHGYLRRGVWEEV